MIVVLGFMKAAPGEADRLHDAMTAMMTESEKEEGCIRYVFSCMAGDPDSLVLTEIWRDQEALDAHFHTPHMAAFNAAVAGAKLSDVSVKQYEIASVKTLMGAD
jgi:quinol monooxygenase YgiN